MSRFSPCQIRLEDLQPTYFGSSQDELLWGAAWLHKATSSPTYLNYIQSKGQSLGADGSDNIFGWDNKHAGARFLLSKVLIGC